MAHEEFRDPRLAAVYDLLDGDRSDLDLYEGIAQDLGAHRVLDVGCGTGVLALRLAGRGAEVVGVDPAAASLDVAREKLGADRVTWLLGTVEAAPAGPFDLVVMTGNAVQQITEDEEWHALLAHVRDRLAPSGRLVFETRDPAARVWVSWTRDATATTTDLPGVGAVETWTEVTRVALPLVAFRSTWRFAADGAVLTSDSTLRFRDRDEVEADLAEAGLTVSDVLGAPDRPGRELVFVTAPSKTGRRSAVVADAARNEPPPR